MTIDDKLIGYLEDLSRLKLTEDEKKAAKGNLADILGYMDKLDELDTEGLEGVSHPFTFTNALRQDIRTDSQDRDEILANAPYKKDGCFKVPKTVE